MKVQKIKLNSYEYTWLVLDNYHLPIKPITEFIRYLNNVDKSPCTIRSYAYHLKLFWEFLEQKQINWIEINLANLAGFVGWLRSHNKNERIIDLVEDRSCRQGSTINVILGCLSSFYRFHNELGNTNVTITESNTLPGNRYKALLHHVYKHKPVQKRIISVKQCKSPPKVITHAQCILLRDSCTNYRDKFLIWLLYETGLRIGQALALRHKDIICWDNEIRVKYRCQNINQVRNKTQKPNILHVSDSVMNLYSDYINSLDQNKLTEYVFINFYDYSPLRYSAVKKTFMSLSDKVGFHIRPHMLRHSHATSLINADWDMALVQKRLGHASIQTTINTYTHIDNKKMKNAFQAYLSNQEKSE
ncbi:tyrosine-type recombinase/integrase [Legionella sainthelensi]|uniref:Transposase n=1 Tax=Legionella sainthelensi TaxID=28087 RepID=A0A2H5FRV4_9GAMM|nr:tyrosine-type recombinase/integrase [Legionella sainthelensi]AUH74250.1 transposase [Legionella sainthelensi]